MSSDAAVAPKKSSNNRGNQSLRKRSAARLAAVQCLYQLQVNDGAEFDVQKLVSDYQAAWAHGVHLGDKALADIEPDYRYLTKLLSGLRDAQELLAPLRTRLLSEAWNKDRLPPVMEAIFDAALFELHGGTLGAKLVIDEYVRIAARFFDEKEITFINGVLHGAGQQLGKLQAAPAPVAFNDTEDSDDSEEE
jgi:N utilization substance protein B